MQWAPTIIHIKRVSFLRKLNTHIRGWFVDSIPQKASIPCWLNYYKMFNKVVSRFVGRLALRLLSFLPLENSLHTLQYNFHITTNGTHKMARFVPLIGALVTLGVAAGAPVPSSEGACTLCIAISKADTNTIHKCQAYSLTMLCLTRQLCCWICTYWIVIIHPISNKQWQSQCKPSHC